jgi:hypothetical protein
MPCGSIQVGGASPLLEPKADAKSKKTPSIFSLTGVPSRLLKASMILSALVKARAADEVARIRQEAKQLYGDLDGGLKLDALASPPKLPKRHRRTVRNRHLGDTGANA